MSLSYGFCLGEEGVQYSSEQFSAAFRAAFGDGICPYGSQFLVSASDTMYITVATGFALVGGRWIKSDESIQLLIQPSNSNFDRYDAIILAANMDTKEVEIKVVQGNAETFPKKHIPVRDNKTYEIVLCNILVRMGTSQIIETDLEDVRKDKELCGIITTIDSISSFVLYIYDFLNSGIDTDVSKIIDDANKIVAKGNEVVSEIEKILIQAGVSKPVGEVEILSKDSIPTNEWLLCDGSKIPDGYSELLALFADGILPNIKPADDRFSAWIYAGKSSM